MNAFDLTFGILLAALVLYGLLRGLVRVVLSIAALIGAFLAANAWHEPLAAHLEASGAALPLRRIVAWAVLFVGVILLGAVLSFLASRLVRAAALGPLDRLAGAALGALAAILAGAALAVPLAAYGGEDARLLRGSRVAPYVTAVSDWINVVTPDGLAQRYERASAALKRTWRDRG
ncbi:MAG TPA: CvpA family protein [Candidatus Polarisedimenticolaceae bacterium]|nr:CvpA family protein [Candidatus Polarisedimenticolaceae bacterium]